MRKIVQNYWTSDSKNVFEFIGPKEARSFLKNLPKLFQRQRRGIVFTIDVIIATVVSASLLLAVSYAFLGYEQSGASTVVLKQSAEDALTAMDKQGTLKQVFSQTDTQAITGINSFLSAALPAYIAANYTFEAYEYTPSGSCAPSCRLDGNSPANSFCTCRRFTNSTDSPCANVSSSTCQAIAQARRMFYQYNSTDRAGVMTLEAWVKTN